MISSQQNNLDDRLFNKGKHATIRYTLALILCLISMIADSHYHSMARFRNGISWAMSPLQLVMDYPVRLMGEIRTLFRTKKELIDENMQLRYQQALLEAELQRSIVLKNENSQLKKLLSASNASRMKTMAAEILAVDTGRYRQLVVLNKGTRDGVFVGQPVLDTKGIMGQIIDVGSMTSTVLLISDAKCAVPIRDDRTGERAILVGTNNMSRLMLINLPKTSSVAVGDLLVTSGLGRRYPEGYPVGRIELVKSTPGDDFIKVEVSPIAKLNRSRLVLLIWPEDEHESLTYQIHQRLNALIGEA